MVGKKSKTIKEVVDSMNEEQKKSLYFLVGEASKDKTKLHLNNESKILIRKALRKWEKDGAVYDPDTVSLDICTKTHYSLESRLFYVISFYGIRSESVDNFSLCVDYDSCPDTEKYNFNELPFYKNISLKSLGIFDQCAFLTDAEKTDIENSLYNWQRVYTVNACTAEQIRNELRRTCRFRLEYCHGTKLLACEMAPRIYKIVLSGTMGDESDLQNLSFCRTYRCEDFGLFDESDCCDVSEPSRRYWFDYADVDRYCFDDPQVWTKVNGALHINLHINKDNMEKITVHNDNHALTFNYHDKEETNVNCAERLNEFQKVMVKENWKRAVNKIKNESNGDLLDYVDRIYVSNPVTVVIFKDGGKEMTKCTKKDTYNEELGILLCIIKHFYRGSQTQFGKEFDAMRSKITYTKDKTTAKSIKKSAKKVIKKASKKKNGK